MKKNNKGFFLAETIIIVALVTTVMAFVYPNVSKLYDNYKNTSLYYDQTEDLYTLKAYSEVNAINVIKECNGIHDNSNDLKELSAEGDLFTKLGISKLYISKYMAELSSSDNYNFNKYLKRLKKTSNDQKSCRLVGVFDGGRFASIKIEKEYFYRQIYSVPKLSYGNSAEFSEVKGCSKKEGGSVNVTFDDTYKKCRITVAISGYCSVVSIIANDGTEINTKVCTE